MAQETENKNNKVMNAVLDYQELMVLYECAMKTMKAKLDIIDAAYKVRHKRNPIQNIQCRRKKSVSIVENLQKSGLEVTVENVQKNIHDVDGIRVICSYLDDVYEVAQAITEQNDLQIVKQKDYISNPKHNGYRSLHLVVRVPVLMIM